MTNINIGLVISLIVLVVISGLGINKGLTEEKERQSRVLSPSEEDWVVGCMGRLILEYGRERAQVLCLDKEYDLYKLGYFKND